MTDTIAIWLALVIGAVLAVDLFHFGWDLHVHLGRGLVVLLEYLAFWR